MSLPGQTTNFRAQQKAPNHFFSSPFSYLLPGFPSVFYFSLALLVVLPFGSFDLPLFFSLSAFFLWFLRT